MPVEQSAKEVHSRFLKALAADPKSSEGQIGLSVSGGGDSIALLHLAARTVSANNLRVITVDHGLRSEAADEIAFVAKQASKLGLEHEVVKWDWNQQGNLQAAARDGRRIAIHTWALTHNIRTVWLGHTEDDQVETVLMRLARGSGIDGLTAMYPASHRDGLRLFRPLLGCSREGLRAWLKDQEITWCDDPSNDDPRFDRVRARQMFTQLEGLGLTRKRLLQTVDHMQAAHLTLQKAAQGFAREYVRQDAGDLIFAADALDLEKADAPRRVMAAGFGWVGNRTYRPRFEQLLGVVEESRRGQTMTLGGCMLTPGPDGSMRLSREAAATKQVIRNTEDENDVTGVFWDHRWYLEGPLENGQVFKALGDGIKLCPQWRAAGTPRVSLLASPSVWQADALIAAPLAGLSQGWSARIVADFHSTAFAIED